MEELERKRKFLINTAYAVAVGVIYYVLARYVLYALMPFTIALIVTFMLKRPVDHLAHFLHIPRRGVAAVLVILFYGTIGALITIGVIRLVVTMLEWFGSLSTIYASEIEPAIQSVLAWYENLVASIDPSHVSQAEGVVNNILGTLASSVASISRIMVGYARNAAIGAPKFLIALIFCIVSSVFMSMDYSNITYFFLAQFPEKSQQTIIEAKNYLVGVLGGMFKSYGFIMMVTWLELTIGLKLIGIEDYMVVALIIAIFDILPALGTGGIMIPWVVIELVQRNFGMAGKLFFLYLIITVVRNILEPKVVGESIGLHPVLLLISIYVGGTILGPAGIILMPFTLIVIKKLNDAGHIHVFRSKYFGDQSAAFRKSYKTGTVVEVDEEEMREKLRG
ncbi:MAG: sporulation integral membrane protein YtvI [Clostridia bacterium]|nr:sporulation integral membrane protein YtvI [Clostridia bacterium]